jgi:NTP pyrophosphatase (non-canonical NTP hydrolase)
VPNRIARFEQARKLALKFNKDETGKAGLMSEYTLDQYQVDASLTAQYPDSEGIVGLAYVTLGLSSEVGEVQGKVKKIIRDKGGNISKEDKEEIAKELGDSLWYIANLAIELGYSLSDIAEMNRKKLFSRMERGTIGGSGDNR